MLNALHRLRDARAGDDGFTLMELVVAMSLMTIIAALTTTFFVGMEHASQKTVDLNVSTANARVALDSWTNLLRLADSPTDPGAGANRFLDITPTSAVFYANVDNRSTTAGQRTAPWEISLALRGGQLVEDDYQSTDPSSPDPSYPSTPTAVHYYSDGTAGNDTATSTGGAWVFQPYVATGIGQAPLLTEPDDCSGGVAGICSGTGDAATILQTVTRVDISFTIKNVSGVTESFTSSAEITGSTAS